jgi:3-deoxy-D-manno-octulosonic acid kinase
MASGSWSGAMAGRGDPWASLARHAIDGHRVAAPTDASPQDLAAIVLALRSKAGPERRFLGPRRSAFVAELPHTGPIVVKEYLRGGLVRHLVTRTHLWRIRRRPEREFTMLARAALAGARVPVPVATATRGRLLYRGWLVTRLVADARPLIEVCDDDERVRDILRDVARQIELLVRSSILHRDLHPGNVIVDADGRAWLVDFDRAFVSPWPARWMRWVYRARWLRAVRKHRLPQVLAGLSELIRGAP